MNFNTEKWDVDEKGEQIHDNLFQKTKVIKKKLKAKGKHKLQYTATVQKEEQKQNIKSLPKKKKFLKKIAAKFMENKINHHKELLRRKTSYRNQKKQKVNVNQSNNNVPNQSNKSSDIPQNIKKKFKDLNPDTKKDISPNMPLETSQKTKKKLKRLNNDTKKVNKNLGINIGNLKKKLSLSLEGQSTTGNSLRERMIEKLSAARFRFLNEQMYTSEGTQAQKLFQSDPDAFKAYHEGYRQQVAQWPMNPLDTIISAIKKMPNNYVIADFGCGDAKLAQSVPQKVNSFDLVSTNENVIACDMAHVPLKNSSVDVAVFCLSLMGTNLKDYLTEANRILKINGTLKIAEVESRFDGIQPFIQGLQRFGFKTTWHDLSHNLFYFLDFVKERDIKHKNKLPTISLKPCLYKKR